MNTRKSEISSDVAENEVKQREEIKKYLKRMLALFLVIICVSLVGMFFAQAICSMSFGKDGIFSKTIFSDSWYTPFSW